MDEENRRPAPNEEDEDLEDEGLGDTPEQGDSNPSGQQRTGTPQNNAQSLKKGVKKLTGKKGKQARAQAWKNTKNRLKKKGADLAKKGVQKVGKKLAQEGAKQAGKAAVRAGAQTAGSAAPVVGNLAAEAATQVAEKGVKFAASKAAQLAKGQWNKLASTFSDVGKSIGKATQKIGMIVGGIWIFLIFMLVFVFSVITNSGGQNQAHDLELAAATESLLSITQTGPPHTNTPPAPGTFLTYTITVSYPEPFQDIRLTAIRPPGTTFDSATQTVTCNNTCGSASTVIYWSARTNDKTTSPLNTSFNIRYKVTSVQNNSRLPHVVSGSVVPASGSAAVE
ncbi:MAG TPA: hypothetical protein VLF20_06375 [Patescibacteria group bacterium]|nr:hypothetical protein [Patescibacteria group bacterium]